MTRETDVTYEIRTLLEALDCAVYSLSQGRTTRQSAGLPDLWVMHPKTGGFWIEVKAPDGRLREHQSLFADRCKRCNVGYVCASSLAIVQAYLEARGVIVHPGVG